MTAAPAPCLPTGTISHADELEDGRVPAPRHPADHISRVVLPEDGAAAPPRLPEELEDDDDTVGGHK